MRKILFAIIALCMISGLQAQEDAVILDRVIAPRMPAPSNISDIEVRHVYADESFRFRRPELVRVGLIVASERPTALSLLDEEGDVGDYREDPKGIRQRGKVV